MTKTKSFLDFLTIKGLVDPVALDSLKKEAKEKNKNAEELLVEKKMIEDKVLYQAKAEFLKIPFRDLSDYEPKPEILKFVPIEACQHYRFVPIGINKKEKFLEVGMLNPNNIDAKEALKFIAHRNNLSPKAYVITLNDFRDILKTYSSLKGEVKEALEELEKELKEEKKEVEPIGKEKIEQMAEEAPITKVVALIIKHAIEQRASDIHIEPGEKSIKIRFRVDGFLHTNLTLFPESRF